MNTRQTGDLRPHEAAIKALERTLVTRRSEMWAALVLEICQQAEFLDLCSAAELSLPMEPRKAAERIASSILVMSGPVFGVRESIVETFGK